MNSKDNSTGCAGEATVTCPISISAVDALADVMDRTGGLVERSQAAKHLSSLLLSWIEKHFGPAAGKPGPHEGSRVVIIHESTWDELLWLTAEVYSAGQLLADLVDELDGPAVSISNATYEARKAVAS